MTPSRCLVTGAAGFIGSHLCERLLDDGHEVVGVDSFTDYYARTVKEANVVNLRARRGFRLLELDLVDDDIAPALDGVDVVFHLAGRPGVRPSWGATFDLYVRDNVTATQRLLECAKGRPLRKLVFASSSSVYGDAESFPTSEDALPRPVSPYGVTKLAAEHLAYLYWKSSAIPAVAVRYFTVYGPRQRPDMAFNRFIRALLAGEEIRVFGDGEQTRDYTYVADAVDGTLRAAFENATGRVFNLGGGSRVTVNGVIALLEGLAGRRARVVRVESAPGDARHTSADITRARDELGYRPAVALRDGLARELEWLRGADHERR